MANNGAPATMALESLLFKATNPANKLEDVNTIKQFCDAVNATPDGPAVACRILAHKIQSPQVPAFKELYVFCDKKETIAQSTFRPRLAQRSKEPVSNFI